MNNHFEYVFINGNVSTIILMSLLFLYTTYSLLIIKGKMDE